MTVRKILKELRKRARAELEKFVKRYGRAGAWQPEILKMKAKMYKVDGKEREIDTWIKTVKKTYEHFPMPHQDEEHQSWHLVEPLMIVAEVMNEEQYWEKARETLKKASKIIPAPERFELFMRLYEKGGHEEDLEGARVAAAEIKDPEMRIARWLRIIKASKRNVNDLRKLYELLSEPLEPEIRTKYLVEAAYILR
jgi:ribosomal protein L16/L10AE